EFNVRTTVEDVGELLADAAYGKGLELATLVQPDVPHAVKGDHGRVRQVLTNLVGNAVKFTSHGEVVVRVSREAEHDTNVVVRFEVTDTGIGIPAERQQMMFEAFEQADASTTRRYGGPRVERNT